MPDVVDLYIPQKEQTVRTRVQWRHGDEIGLAFLDKTRAMDDATDGELVGRVAHLESEVAALRRIVNRLKSEVDRARRASDVSRMMSSPDSTRPPRPRIVSIISSWME